MDPEKGTKTSTWFSCRRRSRKTSSVNVRTFTLPTKGSRASLASGGNFYLEAVVRSGRSATSTEAELLSQTSATLRNVQNTKHQKWSPREQSGRGVITTPFAQSSWSKSCVSSIDALMNSSMWSFRSSRKVAPLPLILSAWSIRRSWDPLILAVLCFHLYLSKNQIGH